MRLRVLLNINITADLFFSFLIHDLPMCLQSLDTILAFPLTHHEGLIVLVFCKQSMDSYINGHRLESCT